MTTSKIDPTSDAARTDPKAADAAREDLSKDAERGLHEAARGGRIREDVDTGKTPAQERDELMHRSGEAGHRGAITK